MTRTLDILDRLIAFPTVSRDSNLDLIDWVQNLLADAGFEVTRIWSPDRGKAGLFARRGPAVDGGICLSAHTDVVPVDGQDWSRPPFRLTQDGARVFGRGTTDMKGFLASALALAERLGRHELSTPLCLSLTYDEEIGCVGIQQMMPEVRRLIGRPRAVIVGEPTSMRVAVGHKGKTALDVICHGQAGHSALAPNFVNAVHVASDFIQQIRELQDRLALGPLDDAYAVPCSTVHIGQIAGGTALNIVPADVLIRMEYRTLVDAAARDIQHEIEDIATRVGRGYPAARQICVNVVNSYPGLNTAASSPTAGWACQMTGNARTTKVPFGTEAGFFAGLGLDAIVIGPGDMSSDGHKADEGLCMSQLAACDHMMDAIGRCLLA